MDRPKRRLRSACWPGGAVRGLIVASLALRRVWERLESGALAITPRDVAALCAASGRPSASEPLATPTSAGGPRCAELLWLIRSHLRDDLQAFVAMSVPAGRCRTCGRDRDPIPVPHSPAFAPRLSCPAEGCEVRS